MTDINFCKAKEQNLNCKPKGSSVSAHLVHDVKKSTMSSNSMNVGCVLEKKANVGDVAVKNDLYSGESAQSTRPIYEKKKPKQRCSIRTKAVTVAEQNGSVDSEIFPQKEVPVIWSLEKEEVKDLKNELIVRRQKPFQNNLKSHQRKKEQQSKSKDLEPEIETQDSRKTMETSKLEVFNAKQSVSRTSSNKSNNVDSDSLFEEEIKLENSPLSAKPIPSDTKVLQPKVPISQKNQQLFGCKKQTLTEIGKNSTTPEFTNEDFPDIRRSNVNTGKFSSDKEHSSVPQTSQMVPKISYSAALRTAPRPKPLQAWQVKQDQILSPEEHSKPGLLKFSGDMKIHEKGDEKKKKKKKRKKKVKEPNLEAVEKLPNQASGKRTTLPVQFDLGEILASAIKTAPKEKLSSTKLTVAAGGLPKTVMSSSSEHKMKGKTTTGTLHVKQHMIPHNVLDSTAPVVKRGKEREIPAKKKPSAMKKVILKEREERKKMREKIQSSDEENIKDETDEVTVEPDVCVLSSVACGYELPAVADSVCDEVSSLEKEVASQIHSRRFREYCDQVLEKEVDELVSVLLKELVRFQDRQYHKDPLKARAKRRLVMGIREVTKHLKLRKIKCLIISPNIERIKSKGGLDDALAAITNLCHEYSVPVVFALKRQALGRVLCKKVPVSVVGIFNYDGAQDYFKTLMERTEVARQKYTEMRKAVEQEIQEKLREHSEDAVESNFKSDT